MNEPVIITSHQRDRLVLMSADVYRRLTGITDGLTPEIEARMERTLSRHKATIIKLAKR